MYKGLTTLLGCLLFPLLLSAQGPISFTASSDAKQVVLDSYFELSFTLQNANGSGFTPPPFTNFNILNGPRKTTNVSSGNGRWSRTMVLTYALQPKKIGKLKIGSASIQANNKTLTTKAITIEVVKGKKSNATTQSGLQANLEEQVFIRAVPNKTDALVGEQIVLDYKLYTTRDIDTYHIISESDYSGFYAQDIRRSGGSRVVREVIDGVQYSTKILKRISLFPQQDGRLPVNPMELQIAVVAEDGGNRRRGFFYTPKVNRLIIKTAPIDIVVKKLPPNAPPTFTGAIGKYYLNANINRTSLSTDDAINLQMTITGNGDVKRILPPPLLLSDSFEVYEPRIIEENSFESSGQITGKKTIEYLILPKHPGRYKLRPAFTYFDSDSSKYLTLQPKTFQIAVSKGSLSANQNRPAKKAKVNEDIRFIKTTTSLSSKGNGFYNTSLFWSLLLFPFIALGGVLVYKQIQNSKGLVDADILRQRRAQKLAQKRLVQAKTFLDQKSPKPFYDEISRAMFGYVCDKLNIPFSELTKQNVNERLQSLDVSEALIQRFMTVIKTSEMALFAGKDNADAMGQTYQDTLAVVAGMEEEIILKEEGM